MTLEEKNRLYALRKAGRSYTEIADEMGISKNTVKTYCRRTGLTPADEVGMVAQVPKHTADKFCPYGYRDDEYFFTLIRYLALPVAWLESHNFP